MNRFRDLLHTKYKSSTKAKKRRRVQKLKQEETETEHEYDQEEEEEEERERKIDEGSHRSMGNVAYASGPAEQSNHTDSISCSSQHSSDEGSLVSVCGKEEASLKKAHNNEATSNEQLPETKRRRAVETRDSDSMKQEQHARKIQNIRYLQKQQQEMLHEIHLQQLQLQHQQQQLILQQQQQLQLQQQLQQKLGKSNVLDASTTGIDNNNALQLPFSTSQQRPLNPQSYTTMETASTSQTEQRMDQQQRFSVTNFMDIEPLSMGQILSLSRNSITSTLNQLGDGGSSSSVEQFPRESFRSSLLTDLIDLPTWDEGDQQGCVSSSTGDNNTTTTNNRTMICRSSTNHTINNNINSNSLGEAATVTDGLDNNRIDDTTYNNCPSRTKKI